MAHIQRRRQYDSPWRVRYEGPDGRERSKSFAKRVDAERFLAAVQVDLAQGSWVDPARGRITVAEWDATWRDTSVDLRRSTLARLDTTMRCQVLPHWGGWRLDSVRHADVRAWVAHLLEAGLSPTTVRKAYFALNDLLRAAVADGRIAVNPARDVPLPAERRGEQRFLTTTEIDLLAAAVRPDRHRLLVLTAVCAGLRWGELAALRRHRVDLDRGRIRVAETITDVSNQISYGPPKTPRSLRTVPIPRSLADQLADHIDRHAQPDTDGLVFTSTRGGPLRRTRFRTNTWLPAVRRAGLEGLRFHDLRHTFVSLWIAAGANPKEVSVRAGHSTVAFTLDRYGHLYQDRDDRVADHLDDLLTRHQQAETHRKQRGLAHGVQEPPE